MTQRVSKRFDDGEAEGVGAGGVGWRERRTPRDPPETGLI